MSIVTLRLPEVKYCQEARPRQCPYCAGETFQRGGGLAKRVSDPRLGAVWVYRYRCCLCRRTFWHYPVGIDRARTVRGYKNWPGMASGLMAAGVGVA